MQRVAAEGGVVLLQLNFLLGQFLVFETLRGQINPTNASYGENPSSAYGAYACSSLDDAFS